MVLPVASGSGTGTGGTGANGDKDKDEQQLSTADRIEELTSPTALRKLVLSYLLHHCYIDTAHAFARDGASTPSASNDGLLAELEQERETARGEAAAATPVPSLGYSNAPLGGSTGGSTPRAGGSSSGSRGTHPLSAPPLSRQDSSMEVEGDHLLASASSSSTYNVRSGASGTIPGGPGPIDEDAEMGEAGIHDGEEDGGSATYDGTNGNGATHSGELGSELSDEDLQSVRLRQEIRDHILAGRIRHATEVLNTHFPTVLNAEERPTYARSKPSKANGSIWSLPSGPTSLEPEHLALNLQIQAFIESVRSANTPSNGVGSMMLSHSSLTSNGHSSSATASKDAGLRASSPAPHNMAQSAPGIAAATISRSSSPAPSSVSSASSSASHPSGGMPTALQSALGNAQLLYASVQRLRNGPYKELYKKELESVTAILAYKDLERSPLKKYLDVKRRKSLADQINSAIMFRTGRPSQPLIESAVRQTTFVWSQLHNEHVAIPQDHPAYQKGARPSGSNGSNNGGGAGGGAGPISGFGLGRGEEAWMQDSGADKKGKTKVPSTFYLPAFLAER
ncbi:hypothetical protein BCV69DRAFT_283616 [Microstroma glucosiphilum]|uniref:CTLH domain-containing protein n=1 Tax=Pseudomicrostroma glucosiphilum TaxID=1684307 RepID=A0A316U492_9BASI|nr:hypothetical protein BCV69DRAFT_283616 [Pseudomicrostroma glucosiphilum]PWN20082.1 hypothetical protein BCV69DRAFT_283616 [Pseudomicrostroma glucosiphilum]